MPGRLRVLLLGGVFLLGGAFFWDWRPASPRLEVEVRIDLSGVPELYSLEVGWDRLALQWEDEELGPNPPGGHGVLLDATWVELPTAFPSTRFVRSRSAHQVLYAGSADPGEMGRVWPMALRVKTATASGRELPIDSILEPIRVHFPLQAGVTTTLRVELVVIKNLGQLAGTYALYTKAAYWVEGGR